MPSALQTPPVTAPAAASIESDWKKKIDDALAAYSKKTPMRGYENEYRNLYLNTAVLGRTSETVPGSGGSWSKEYKDYIKGLDQKDILDYLTKLGYATPSEIEGFKRIAIENAAKNKTSYEDEFDALVRSKAIPYGEWLGYTGSKSTPWTTPTPITAPANTPTAGTPTTGTNPTLKQITDPKTWTTPATTGVAPIQDSQSPIDKSFLGAGTDWVHNLLGGRKNWIEAPNGNDTNPFQANALSAVNMARKASVNNPFDTTRRVSPPKNNWSNFYNYHR